MLTRFLADYLTTEDVASDFSADPEGTLNRYNIPDATQAVILQEADRDALLDTLAALVRAELDAASSGGTAKAPWPLVED